MLSAIEQCYLINDIEIVVTPNDVLVNEHSSKKKSTPINAKFPKLNEKFSVSESIPNNNNNNNNSIINVSNNNINNISSRTSSDVLVNEYSSMKKSLLQIILNFQV